MRDRLRGVRLVSEIGITATDRRRLSALMMLHTRGRSSPAPLMASRWPGIYVTYLVAVAIEHGRGGELWPHTVKAFREDTSTAGESFIKALGGLGLPTFDDLVEQEQAFKYVGRVLAHAGLPASSAEAFLAFLARCMRRDGVRSAADLLATWRTERLALEGLPAPARRFLLYGGRTAEDLLGRCIEAVSDAARTGRVASAEQSGLPSHLAEALQAVPHQDLTRSRRAPTGVPRPTIALDPFDNLGLVAVLPPVAHDRLGARWRVWDGEREHETAASSIDAARIRLKPAPAWTVEFLDEQGSCRAWSFEGLERTGALIVDPESYLLSRTPTVIEDDQAWIVHPSAWQLQTTEGALRELAEMPPIPGTWSAYAVTHADLTGVSAVSLVSPADPAAGGRIRVYPGGQRPRLLGTVVEGVRTEQGHPVFSAPPAVCVPQLDGVPSDRWHFRLRRIGGADTTFIDPDGVEEGQVGLASRTGGDVGLFRLAVRGPLGADILATFAVVPGLEIERPTRTVFPEDAHAAVRMSADPGIAVSELGQGEALDIPIPVGVRSLAVTAASEREKLELRVDVPTLLWTLVHDTKPATPPSAQRIRVGAEEFDDELADSVVVRVGRPNVPLALSLRDGQTTLTEELTALSAGAEGRWSFDLSPLATTIRRHADVAPRIWLRVGTREACIADVIPQLELTGLRAQSRVTDAFTHVLVSFEQSRQPRHRVVRLWSMDRPWDRPISEEVAEGTTCVEISGWDRIAPGRYLVEVALDDGWIAPRRPAPNAPHTAVCRVGDRTTAEGRLDRLDPSDPLHALELIMRDREVEGDLTGSDAYAAAHAAGVCLMCEIESLPPDRGPHHRFARCAAFVFGQAELAVKALADITSEDVFTPEVVLRTQLGLVRLLDDVCVDDDEVLRRAWRSLPVLAATLDRASSELARQRRERFLYADAQLGVPPGGGRVDQRMAGSTVTELHAIRQLLALVPDAALDAASTQLACFEWLSVEVDEEVDSTVARPSTWLDRFGHLTEQIDDDWPAVEHVRGRARVAGTIEWADFTQALLAAATHLVMADGNRPGAAMALSAAASFAPRLIVHDVLLATTLLSSSTPEIAAC